MVIFASGFGIASVCVGLFIAAEGFGISQRQGIGVEIIKGYFVAAGFMGLGVLWACSSRLYWTQKNRIATFLNFGTLASAAVFWLLLELGVIP
ncbi:hypothetical protein [Aporhodopirellula aestuarii]|nr:hypothetical protein [Aporhodopirellula aestuarii]